MKVAIINTLYPPYQVGGAEKSVALLAEALVKRGDDVSVIALHPERQVVSTWRNGVRCHLLPLKNIYWPFMNERRPHAIARFVWHALDVWNLRAARLVGEILDSESPDVVHTNILTGFSAAVWQEVKRRRIRLVHTLRDYSLLCARSSLFKNGRQCRARCLSCTALTLSKKALSHRVDVVVSNSQAVLDTHRAAGYFAGVPERVVFNIAELDQLATPGAVRTGHTVVFGFIGRIDPEKGVDVLLRATRMLSRQNWRVVIAGRGFDAYVSHLKASFPDPRIEWLGFVDAAAFYDAIDVSIVPSVWKEPLPRSLIETLAKGLTAICARSGGIPEIAKLGKLVELYDAEDPAQLAALMNAAMDDPARWRAGGFAQADGALRFRDLEVAVRYRAAYAHDE
jgi:glycosyltransferase involved in cell wall biosynthesis